jgi:hypothetical protein
MRIVTLKEGEDRAAMASSKFAGLTPTTATV